MNWQRRSPPATPATVVKSHHVRKNWFHNLCAGPILHPSSSEQRCQGWVLEKMNLEIDPEEIVPEWIIPSNYRKHSPVHNRRTGVEIIVIPAVGDTVGQIQSTQKKTNEILKEKTHAQKQTYANTYKFEATNNHSKVDKTCTSRKCNVRKSGSSPL